MATVYSVYNGSLIASFTNTGYIGGDASDIDTGGGNAPHAQRARALRPNAAMMGAGITIVPATVTFSPDSLIKLGLGSPTHYWTTLTATVTPPAFAKTVSFSASNGEVNVTESTVNPSTGIITLNVTAVSPTPGLPTNPSRIPDCFITANGISNLDPFSPGGSVPALVLIPKSIGQPHTTYNGPLTGYNDVLGPSTSPAYHGAPGKVLLVTVFVHKMTITVDDQFGHVLDSIFEGAPVTEYSANSQTYTNINQSLTAQGTYSDLVGTFAYRPVEFIVNAKDPLVGTWKDPANVLSSDFIQGIGGKPSPAAINVAVGGQPLNPSIQGRTVRITQSPDNIDIEWP